MSYAVMTVAVDDMMVDPMGVKEAAVMALEPLGRAFVLRVETYEPEQLGLEGIVPARPPAPRTSPERAKSQGGQAPAASVPAKPSRKAPTAIVGCRTCAHFREEHGWDESRQGYWGQCEKTGERVYKLWAQCGAWKAVT